MADKKYVDYSRELYNEYSRCFKMDTIEIQKIIRQIEEVAQKTGSKEWKLYVDFFNLILYKKKSYFPKYCSDEMLLQLFNLLEKAIKENVVQIELRCRVDILLFYYHSKKYELALEQSNIIVERLQNVSSCVLPEKLCYYVSIGNIYYDFKDYPKAVYYFEKALSEKDNISYQGNKMGALNGIGLIYRYGFEDYERSDSCFRAILQTNYLNVDDKKMRGIWDGIAEGNIARNLMLRGEHEKAIPIFKSSIDTVLNYNDFAYATGLAVFLAEIYLKKGNIRETKKYLDLAKKYYTISPRKSNLPLIFENLSKYYAATGNTKLCHAYLDSTLSENKRLHEEFNALLLIRVEQRKHLSEQQLKEKQLLAEKIKNIGYKRSLLIAIAGLFLVGSLMLFYIILYRKKKAAYRELVLKSQEWAQNHFEHAYRNEACRVSTDTDIQLFEQLQQLFQLEKNYNDTSISVEKVANQLKTNKTYLSQAINRCTGKNFNTYINEYRIKEAIRLISIHPKKFSLEGFALEVGFNDRKTFYTAFKKVTGLSPSEFRDNIVKI